MARKKTTVEAAVEEPVAASLNITETSAIENAEEPAQDTTDPVPDKQPVPKRRTSVKKAAQTEKVWDREDQILCRSVTEGRLVVHARKSGNVYRFYQYGDETYILYEDLYDLLINQSGFLFTPRFMVEDEELIVHSRWKTLKEFYDKLYSVKDVRKIINLPPAQFEKELQKLPKGMIDVVKIRIASDIEKGIFDSLSKINIMDRVCGTDFKSMVVR